MKNESPWVFSHELCCEFFPIGRHPQILKIQGRTFELEEAQKLVGGYIEIVRLPSDRIAVINEDGIGLDLPYNWPATARVAQLDPSNTFPLRGNVLIMDSALIQ